MKIGNEISFTYLKGADAGIVKGVLTKDYASKAEAYTGKVVEIRDIAEIRYRMKPCDTEVSKVSVLKS